MNAYTELHERCHALLFTVEQGCRRQGIRQWDAIRRYLLAATCTVQGRTLLIDAITVDEYISRRQMRIAEKHHSPAGRTASRLLAARDHQQVEAFMRMVEAIPPVNDIAHVAR